MNRSRVTGDLASQGNIFVDIANDRVGIGSTIPTQKLDVAGTVKATAFSGDGSNLDGINTDLVSDTSPQLGGNLDTNGSQIFTSQSNGNIPLQPNGNGNVEVKGAGGNDGTLQLNCSANSHGIKLKSPPHSAAATYTLTFPNTDGNANQVLKSDGSGNLDWVSITDSNCSFVDLTLTDTDAGSAAGPELKLFRNSASPADADYIGQIKFAGESDTGVERNYAKITGKILDASNGTEDGILEFAHIKAGSQTITGRWRSDSLQLLNDTNLTVDGTTTLNNSITLNSDDSSPARIDLYCEVSNAHYTRLQAPAHSTYSGNVTVTIPNASGNLAVLANAANNRIVTATGTHAMTGESTLTYDGSGTLEISSSGSSYTLRGAGVTKHEIGASASDNDLVIQNNKDAGNVTSNIIFKGSGASGAAVSEKMRIDSSGNVLVGTTDSTIYNNGDSASEGIVLRNGEVIDIARKGDLQLTLNRQTNDGPHIAFYRSGAAKHFISTFDNDLVFEIGGSSSSYRKHRFNSTGDILLGAHGSRIFDDSSGTNVVVDIYGGTTAGKRGILALGGRSGSDNADIGTIQFLNENNAIATAANHVQSKLVASIDTKSETTTNNSGANSGGHLIFSTKAENASLEERLRITSAGTVEFHGGDQGTEHIKIQSEAGGQGLFIANFQGVSDTGDSSSRLGVGKDDNILIFTNATASASQVQNFAIGNTDSIPLVFSTHNTKRLVITGAGQLQHQSGTGVSYFNGASEYIFNSTTSSPPAGGYESPLQVHTSKTRSAFTLAAFNNNSGGPFMTFISSRSTTRGTLGSAIGSADTLGDIRFTGDNGTNYNSVAIGARISAKAASAPGSGDSVIAGRLMFATGAATAASGSTSTVMEIREDGHLMLKRGRVNNNGSVLYCWGGYIAGTGTFTLDVPVFTGGNIYRIDMFYSHHSLSYGAYKYGIYGAYSGHSGLQINNDIASQSSSNNGSWTVTRGSAGQDIVITKTAGTYSGGGYWFVNVYAGNYTQL